MDWYEDDIETATVVCVILIHVYRTFFPSFSKSSAALLNRIEIKHKTCKYILFATMRASLSLFLTLIHTEYLFIGTQVRKKFRKEISL